MYNHYKQRNESLKKLGFNSYKEYLSSPLWKGIRLKVMDRENNICQICHITKAEHIHHHNYAYKTLRGDKRKLRHLVAICKNCHEKAEFLDNSLKATLPQANARMGLPSTKICPCCNKTRSWTDFQNFSGTATYNYCKSCRKKRKAGMKRIDNLIKLNQAGGSSKQTLPSYCERLSFFCENNHNN